MMDSNHNDYKNSIVTLNNCGINDTEMFNIEFGNADSLCLIPLSYSMEDRGEKDTYTSQVLNMFMKFDDNIENFLGIRKTFNKEETKTRINELLQKEQDNMHKYYVIHHAICFQPIGLFYVYDYREKYKRCNIGIGFIKEFRGKGYAGEVIETVTDELMRNNGMIRVGAEVETTNKASLAVCEKQLSKIGFMYEGIKRNTYGIGIDCKIFAKIKEN